MKELSLVFDEIPKKKIAVIGDIMLDHYFWGKWGKASLEAPSRVISVKNESFVPGGAGNTAVNVSALGAKSVLLGRFGNDTEADILLEKLKQAGVILDALPDSVKTITKNRVIVDGQQNVRFDCEFEESNFQISESFEKKSINLLLRLLELDDYNAILISDYNKGFVTEKIVQEILRVATKRNKVVIVDTKPKHFEWFKRCYCIKPNKVEAEEFTGIKIENLKDAEKAGLEIKKRIETNVLLTLGSMGMFLFEEERITHFSSFANNVFDVTGAGDTVLAAFSLALVAGASMRDAAALANHAAAIVIGKLGTASVSLEELKKSIL